MSSIASVANLQGSNQSLQSLFNRDHQNSSQAFQAAQGLGRLGDRFEKSPLTKEGVFVHAQRQVRFHVQANLKRDGRDAAQFPNDQSFLSSAGDLTNSILKDVRSLFNQFGPDASSLISDAAKNGISDASKLASAGLQGKEKENVQSILNGILDKAKQFIERNGGPGKNQDFSFSLSVEKQTSASLAYQSTKDGQQAEINVSQSFRFDLKVSSKQVKSAPSEPKAFAFDPKPIAKNILDFSLSLFGAYSKNHSGENTKDQLKGFQSLILDSVGKGIDAAKKQLGGFSPAFKNSVDAVSSLVSQGVQDFVDQQNNQDQNAALSGQ